MDLSGVRSPWSTRSYRFEGDLLFRPEFRSGGSLSEVVVRSGFPLAGRSSGPNVGRLTVREDRSFLGRGAYPLRGENASQNFIKKFCRKRKKKV